MKSKFNGKNGNERKGKRAARMKALDTSSDAPNAKVGNSFALLCHRHLALLCEPELTSNRAILVHHITHRALTLQLALTTHNTTENTDAISYSTQVFQNRQKSKNPNTAHKFLKMVSSDAWPNKHGVLIEHICLIVCNTGEPALECLQCQLHWCRADFEETHQLESLQVISHYLCHRFFQHLFFKAT
jgi:hypothetical protein